MKGNDGAHLLQLGSYDLMTLVPINTTLNQHCVLFSLCQVLNTIFFYSRAFNFPIRSLSSIRNQFVSPLLSDYLFLSSFILDNMPFAYLLKTREDIESFKVKYNIPHDVEISYCHEDEIANQRLPHVILFPLMSILEGGVRFPVDPLLLRTLSFYGLSLDHCLPNFYRVVNCVRHLNRLYGLSLTHHDINFLYAIRGSLKLKYYLQTQNTMVRLISYLLDSNRNLVKEYIRVSGNWLNREMTCPTSPHQIGRYLFTFCFISLPFVIFHLYFPIFPIVVSKKFQPNIRVVRVKEVNFILRSEIFVHYNS